MDKTLMHWRAWGLMHTFVGTFGIPPTAPDGLPPAELAKLLQRSILAGEVAAPLWMEYRPARVYEVPSADYVPRPPRSDKLRKYLDNL